MEISDLDTIVYGALRQMRNGVLTYVRPRLRAEFGQQTDTKIRELFQKEWAEIERSALVADQAGYVDRVPTDALDHLSVNHLSTLMDKWWKVLAPDPSVESSVASKQRSNVVQWLRELTGIRNPVAHPPDEPLALPDALRAVDSAHRVALLLGLEMASRLQATWDALVDTSAPDEVPQLVVDELPSRELITTEFVGRENHLADLFRWLSDPDRRTWLLAGDGGKGKTTVAYEFAARARPVLADFGLCGTLWMSAKRRRFADGETVPTSRADFSDLESALDHVLDRLGVGTDPNLTPQERRQVCRELLDEFPVLIVADDIDSLEGTEEEAIEFLVHDVARTKSKVLMTSRREHFGLGACTTPIEGLNEEEVSDLVHRRAAALGIDTDQVNARVVKDIRNITDGSPLYIEDLLRFARFYSVKRAISEWSGRGGDAAREYSMRRELEKLSGSATLCLGVLALAEDPMSLEECAVIADLPDADAMTALEELCRWNLATKPGLIEDVPRFACSRNLAKLVRGALEGSDQELRIRNGIRGVQGVAVASSRVRAWNQQAVVLKERGQQAAAEDTLLAGLKEVPNSGEIYSQLGWLYSKWEPSPRTTDASAAFRKARALGAMSRHLYAHWATMELQTREYRHAAELCEEAVEAVGRSDTYLWRLGGVAYTRLAVFHETSFSTESARKSFNRAGEMLAKSQDLARTDGDRSKALNCRYQLARSERDQAAMRRVLEEWEQVLPNDPYREPVTR